jgi:hypothetical protein
VKNIEGVIRPFQLEDVFTARSLPPAPVVVQSDSPVFTWGKPNPTDLEKYAPFIMTFEAEFSEESRTTEVVRIENPDAPEQFVDVERITNLVLANEEGQKIKWNLNNG